MRAVQRFLPNPRHREIDRIFVAASPAVAWEEARHLDLSAIPWIRALFSLRTLPDRLAGRPEQPDRGVGIDQIAAANNGFMLLEDRPPRDVVIGAVGKFWQLNIPFADVAPELFAGFVEPGWGKLAWSIEVEEIAGGSTIALELRTTAGDQRSWERLHRYYSLIGPFSRLIRRRSMALMEERLGALERPDDATRELPGDEWLPQASRSLTHSIDIEAPRSLVWRYLMQLGCDRAGWYSIDLLDNGGRTSVDHLVPGWERRAPGEKIAATPARDGFFDVYSVEPERFLLLGGEAERLGGPFRSTWAFVLDPIGADATRLMTRVRMEAEPPLAELLEGAIIAPPIHAIMQRTQLRTIRRLAERDALARQPEELEQE